jgi:hypothetical protein
MRTTIAIVRDEGPFVGPAGAAFERFVSDLKVVADRMKRL